MSGPIGLSFTTLVANQCIYKPMFAASTVISSVNPLRSNVSAAQELRRDNARDSTQHASAGFTSSSLLSSVGARSIFDWPYQGRLSQAKGGGVWGSSADAREGWRKGNLVQLKNDALKNDIQWETFFFFSSHIDYLSVLEAVRRLFFSVQLAVQIFRVKVIFQVE